MGACGLGGPFFNGFLGHGFPGRVGKPDKENIEESSTLSVYILEERERARRRATKCKDEKKQIFFSMAEFSCNNNGTKLDGAKDGKRKDSSGVPK